MGPAVPFLSLPRSTRKYHRAAQRLGELAAKTDIEEATHRLVALIDGLSVEAVLYPARVPPDRQVALLDQLLRDFAKPPLHPARTLTE